MKAKRKRTGILNLSFPGLEFINVFHFNVLKASYTRALVLSARGIMSHTETTNWTLSKLNYIKNKMGQRFENEPTLFFRSDIHTHKYGKLTVNNAREAFMALEEHMKHMHEHKKLFRKCEE